MTTRRGFDLKKGLIGMVWRRILIGSMVVVAISGSSKVIKLRSDDLDRIEEEMGKTVEDMTEDELIDAMKKMGIKEQKFTSKDKEKVIEEIDFCPNCESSIEPGEEFCPYCGHDF
ncbi:MAG: zinc ribbon domain-containing protein [Candidatus Hodarchaeota archaeon]